MADQANDQGQISDTTATRIAAALEEYNKQVARPAGLEAAPAVARNIQAELDAAIEAGDLKAAMSLQQELFLGEQLKTAMVTQQTAASTARMAAQQQIPDFMTWAPKAEALAKARGIDPNGWTSVEAWREAITYTKGAHADEIATAAQATLRAELEAQINAQQHSFPAYARGSVAPPNTPADVDLSALPKEGLRFAQEMRVPVAQYAAAAKHLERFDNGDGSIAAAPLIMTDSISRDEFGDVVVKKGEF